MKKFAVVAVLSFCSVIVSWANSAHAMVSFGWERPILKSEMVLTKARPECADVKSVQLIMTKQDGNQAPTGFILLIDDQVMNFAINGTPQKAECASLVYSATVIPNETRGGESCLKLEALKRLTLTLADHSGRQCQDAKANRWEATLFHNGRVLFSAAGNIEPVFTIQ